MKTNTKVHYRELQVRCRCGNAFTTRSVLGTPLQIDVCSQCHPAFTGSQKPSEQGQRILQFQKKYGL